MAALLQGFINFRKDVHVAGVIYNKVGSERHYRMLKEVCEDLHIDCLGYLPKQLSLEQGSRYLGLDYTETAVPPQLLTLIEEHIAWEKLLTL
jgi:cobyrinic acid a,c-diamide synthase